MTHETPNTTPIPQQKQSNVLNEKTMIPIAAVASIVFIVVGGILYLTNQQNNQREWTNDNFVRQEEFRPVAEDVAEIKKDVKSLLLRSTTLK